jgi:hypothetical protein
VPAVSYTLPLIFFALTFLLGAAIGTSELVSRYRDAPLRALLTMPSLLYIGLNAFASVSALAIVRQFGWLEGDGSNSEINKLIIQSLAAGVSAMALFRTSLFTIRVANADIGIGPAAFLQILLSAADRATDRIRAKPRALAVQEIMSGISFGRAKQVLPSLCFGLMQNVGVEEQRTFGTVVNQLETAQMDDVFKANNLGLALMNVVGEGVLRQAVGMLRKDISAPPRQIVQSIQTLQLLRKVKFSASAEQAVESCIFIANKMQDEDLKKTVSSALKSIQAMTVPERQKVFLLSTVLISTFGEETVQSVLKSLPENDTTSEQQAVASSGSSDSPTQAASADEKVVEFPDKKPEPDPRPLQKAPES